MTGYQPKAVLSIRLGVLLLAAAVGGGCTSMGDSVAQSDEAFIESDVRVVRLDGEPHGTGLEFRLSPGSHTMVVELSAWFEGVQCRFEFTAEAGQRYEVSVRSTVYPVTMYHLVPATLGFVNKRNQQDPVACAQIS